MYKKILFAVSAILLSGIAFGQEALKSVEEEYYDFLALQGLVERPTLGYRTLSDSVWALDDDVEHSWQGNNLGSVFTIFNNNSENDNWFSSGINKSFTVKAFGPDLFISYNNKVPFGQNDGALWQGVGINTSFTTGVRAEVYGFEVTFKPQITWSQNKDFEYLSGVYGDSHSYFWRGNIDLVQRFGDTSYWQFDWGDSEIRYTFHNFTLGFGTQSPWLGPAQLNPMLGSINAGTYPKFDFGLRKTDIIIPGVDWNLGRLETRIWIGQLTESDYFDGNEQIDKNLINGFNISFSPAFFPEFTIGATKICLTRWGDNFIKYLNPFYSENNFGSGILGEDQKASVYFDILFPKVGFEFYFEVGLDDYPANFLANPFHTFIYTTGIQKYFSMGEKLSAKNVYSKLLLEFNMFEMSQDFQLEWGYMGYYAHSSITEGYSNKGQLLGAGSGYFGNSQLLNYSIYYPKGKTSFIIHRTAPATNYVYNHTIYEPASPSLNERWFDSYMSYTTAGLDSTYYFISNLSTTMGIYYIHLENVNFVKYHTLNTFKVNFAIKYNF